MGDGARLKRCPGCGQDRIVRFSRTKAKWLWETHKKDLYDSKSRNCEYSNREFS